MKKPSLPMRARTLQVRAATRLFLLLNGLPLGGFVVRTLAAVPGMERLLVGYRSAFRTKAEADWCREKYDTVGHVHPDAIRQHIGFGEQKRPSDYAALYHLGRLLPSLDRIVDVGGSAGNVFYCYARHLEFPKTFCWSVVDLEETVAEGKVLANERGEQRLEFGCDLGHCKPAELVLFSGSLHFLEAMPPELLAAWSSMPKHILINRSPVAKAPSVYSVQDQGTWLTTARVLDRTELVEAMQRAGYALVDEWPAYELQMKFPMRSANSVNAYSGFLFSRP